MTPTPSPVTLAKVRKLAQLADELRQGRGCEITRLTSLKSLCQEAAVANCFVTYLVRKTLERVAKGKGRPKRMTREKALFHRQLMADALAAMDAWIEDPSDDRRNELRELHYQFKAEQNEQKRIKWGSVRIIRDADLLMVEYAVECLLSPHAAGPWAYQTARHYAERYDARFGTSLVPASFPMVQDIVDFWTDYFGIKSDATVEEQTPAQPAKASKGKGRSRKTAGAVAGGTAKFTQRQGQFLAFIHDYCKLNRRGPGELDMVRFFRVTPPSVHSMVVKLHQLGLIEREPGVARSIRVAIPEEDIPRLQDAGTGLS